MERTHWSLWNSSYSNNSLSSECQWYDRPSAQGCPQGTSTSRALGYFSSHGVTWHTHSALKDDLCCTAAELVYGTSLCLPGDFFSPLPDSAADPASYVTHLKSTMQQLWATPPRVSQRPAYVSAALSSCTHVFVRRDVGTCKLCRHSFGLTLMPDQCWHNRDIVLPTFAIVSFINFLPNYPTKYIDHKAVIILHMCYLD